VLRSEAHRVAKTKGHPLSYTFLYTHPISVFSFLLGRVINRAYHHLSKIQLAASLTPAKKLTASLS